MTPTPDAQKIAVLREAVDRADTLSIAQSKTIDTQAAYLNMQDNYIKSLEKRLRELEGEVSELRCALSA